VPQFQPQPAPFGFVLLPVPARGSSCVPFLPFLRREKANLYVVWQLRL
jgi:hypothetical protein